MSGGYLIQERACPRCAIRWTVRLTAGNSFCFNCRLQWSTQQVARGQPVRWMTALPLTSHPFTPAEQARMAIYRAAVRAGFYSDWPGTSLVLTRRCGGQVALDQVRPTPRPPRRANPDRK
jgi:hypothetical protein